MGFRGLCRQTLGFCWSKTRVAKHTLALIATLGTIGFAPSLFGQNNNGGGFFRQPVVGGVKIDTDGVLRLATQSDQNEMLAELRKALVNPAGELNEQSDSRLISLKNLQTTVLEAIKNQKDIPQEVLFLGGLTRIENIYVFPENNDIVLAGPSEPWTLGPNGTVVGTKSGRPIVILDDLLSAMRTVENARQTGISVSIEPTEEGSVRLNHLLAKVNVNQTAWSTLEAAMREAFGPQQVKLTGVSPDSRFARVILAADFKMKLYGMNLAKAPVKGLPSYLEMVSKSTTKRLASRWWMACDYSAIEHSEDKLSWKISGRGVKTLTEEEQIAADGSVKGLGKSEPIAKKWADTFTSKLEELAVSDPVFGELRNIMDLCVVAAIIESNRLQDLAQCDLSPLFGNNAIEAVKLETPKTLEPQCSFIKTTGQSVLVTASGGVLIDSWQVASTAQLSTTLSRESASKKLKDKTRVWH